MKSIIITILVIFLGLLSAFGQNENPYAEFGYEAPIMKDKGQIFKDTVFIIINNDTTSQISWLTINTEKRIIRLFSKEGVEISKDTLLCYTTARWLTTDPARQYHSPYLGMGNNPVNGVDPDGRNFFGDWIVDINTGQKTKISNHGDDVGLDFVNYVDGDLKVLGSFTAKIGTWDGKLLSRKNNFMSKEAQINIMKNHIYQGQINFIETTGNITSVIGDGITYIGYATSWTGVGASLIPLGKGIGGVGDAISIYASACKGDYISAVSTAASMGMGYGLKKGIKAYSDASSIPLDPNSGSARILDATASAWSDLTDYGGNAFQNTMNKK